MGITSRWEGFNAAVILRCTADIEVSSSPGAGAVVRMETPFGGPPHDIASAGRLVCTLESGRPYAALMARSAGGMKAFLMLKTAAMASGL